MSSDRIKVPGYAQRVFYNDGIEYRNFSPDLVGLQLASDGSTPLFTMGNFSVTTNFEPKKNKNFITTNFSNFVTLSDLDLTLESAQTLLVNNAGVILNLDKRNLSNYALFGSFSEFVRVSLEDIIINWPAALYVNPVYSLAPAYLTLSGYTIENYQYDSLTDESTFSVNVNNLANNFQINFLSNTQVQTSENELRNLTLNYLSYSILYHETEFDVIGFTGSTNSTNDYINFNVKGNVFSGAQTNDYPIYYVKPNKTKENLFYNNISDFESYLLNRLTVPKFTSSFDYTIKSDTGDILHVTDSISWPTTDGYNIDFDTDEYNIYATKLLEISNNFDLSTSNLMVRFLVSDSITDFDTTDIHFDPLDVDNTDQKMNKTLTIYGREYDDINKFITGIKYSNTVTYDKNNNTPDIYLKNLAKVLGWDLISSILENDLLKSYIEPKKSTYSGQTVGLTLVEADIELWRRIILNTPWIWKSKGSRKSVEFLFKFIGTPLGLISFNEYIYLAENKINLDQFEEILQLNGLDTDLNNYPISLSGYPQPFLNTPDLYFQNNGLWYRETGGDNSSIDITSGNNPHVGPYDGGFEYINQFRTLIPNFSAVTLSSETTVTNSVNLFTNYNRGTMTEYTGNTYVDITNDSGVDFSNCFIVVPEIIEDPKHRQDETNCGCEIPSNLKSLSLCVDKNKTNNSDCSKDIASISSNSAEKYYEFSYNQYNIDGSLYKINGNPIYYVTPFVSKECCNFSNSVPYFWNKMQFNNSTSEYELVNSGYICCQASNTCGCLTTCKWNLDSPRWVQLPINGQKYLSFVTELGEKRIASKDGCNCIAGYSTPIQIIDPYTNEVGMGCQLTQLGINDIDAGDSILVKTYNNRATEQIGCSSIACDLQLTMTTTESSGLNGTATVNVSGGIAPYQYLWNNGATTQTITGLSAGTYTVNVVDSSSCSGVVSAPVNVAPITPTCNLGLTVTSTDTTATANVTGAIGTLTYLWSNGGTSQTITGLTSQLYSVTVTDNGTGCQTSGSVLITYSSLIRWGTANNTNNVFTPVAKLYYKINSGSYSLLKITTVGSGGGYSTVETIPNLKTGDIITLYPTDLLNAPIIYGIGINGVYNGYCGPSSPYSFVVNSSNSIYLNLGSTNSGYSTC